MSLLLDALNKADQERKRNEAAPGISSNHEQRGDSEPRTISPLLIAVIVIALFILLAAIYWLGQRSTTATVVTAPTPANTTSKAIANKASKSLPTNTEEKAPEPTQETIDGAPDESVANLYQHTQVPDTNTAITISTPPPVADAPAPINNEPAPAAGSNSITQFANLPEIHDLPNNILQRIPSLGYSEHHYDPNGGSVKINGEIKHVNEQLPSGIVIDKILEDGMILHIDNYSFKMRAMNSWVNM